MRHTLASLQGKPLLAQIPINMKCCSTVETAIFPQGLTLVVTASVKVLTHGSGASAAIFIIMVLLFFMHT